MASGFSLPDTAMLCSGKATGKIAVDRGTCERYSQIQEVGASFLSPSPSPVFRVIHFGQGGLRLMERPDQLLIEMSIAQERVTLGGSASRSG